MRVRIAVIGSRQTIEDLQSIANEIHDIEILPYCYQNPQETSALFVEAEKTADVVLFSGIVPYYYGINPTTKYSIPITFIPFHEYMVSASILYILYHLQLRVDQLSIDLPNADLLFNIGRNLEIDVSSLSIKEYRWIYDEHEEKVDINMNEFVEFHLNSMQTGKSSFALTSIHMVYDKLTQLGVPAIYMKDSEQNLRTSLEHARDLARLEQSKQSQISFLAFAPYQKLSDVEAEFFLQELHAIFTDHAKLQISTVKLKAPVPALFFTTRGVVDVLTQAETQFPLLIEFETRIKYPLALGIGYGYTIIEAEEHAKRALDHALDRKEQGNVAYIIDYRKRLIGPLGNDAKIHQLRVDNFKIRELSERTHVSTKNLMKLLEFVEFTRFRPFTSIALAEYLGVTRRTSERLIKKLLTNQIVDIFGLEQAYELGRPSAVYRLNDDIKKELLKV